MRRQKISIFQLILIALTGIAIIFFILSLINVFSNRSAATAAAGKNNGNIIAKNLVSFWEDNKITAPELKSTDPILGNSEAPITIYEYSSLSCPNSAKMNPIVKEIVKIYPQEVRLVWKDLPLSDTYPDATLAHLAARCAQKQNKFWEYQELLWNNQNDFSRDNLILLAKESDLDETVFANCLDNQETAGLVNEGIAEAKTLDIPGTPHFYINSQELLGLNSLADFQKIIEVELNRNK